MQVRVGEDGEYVTLEYGGHGGCVLVSTKGVIDGPARALLTSEECLALANNLLHIAEYLNEKENE